MAAHGPRWAPAAASRPARCPHGAGAPDPSGTPVLRRSGVPLPASPWLQPEGCSCRRLGASPAASPRPFVPHGGSIPFSLAVGGPRGCRAPHGGRSLLPAAANNSNPFSLPTPALACPRTPLSTAGAQQGQGLGGSPPGGGSGREVSLIPPDSEEQERSWRRLFQRLISRLFRLPRKEGGSGE